MGHDVTNVMHAVFPRLRDLELADWPLCPALALESALARRTHRADPAKLPALAAFPARPRLATRTGISRCSGGPWRARFAGRPRGTHRPSLARQPALTRRAGLASGTALADGASRAYGSDLARRTDRPRLSRWPLRPDGTGRARRPRLADRTLLPERTIIATHARKSAQTLLTLQARLAALADRTGLAALAPRAVRTARAVGAVAHQRQPRLRVGRHHLAQGQHFGAHLRDRCARLCRDQFTIAGSLLALGLKQFAERLAPSFN
jgi:hypothetical protein